MRYDDQALDKHLAFSPGRCPKLALGPSFLGGEGDVLLKSRSTGCEGDIRLVFNKRRPCSGIAENFKVSDRLFSAWFPSRSRTASDAAAFVCGDELLTMSIQQSPRVTYQWSQGNGLSFLSLSPCSKEYRVRPDLTMLGTKGPMLQVPPYSEMIAGQLRLVAAMWQ